MTPRRAPSPTSSPILLPGTPLGVLGGGQLGLFFSIAARRMGYRVVLWDSDPDAPAQIGANLFVCKPFDDPVGLRSFLKEVRAVTYEREHLPLPLVEAIEAEVPLRPDCRTLRLLQNRLLEKETLSSAGLPVVSFCPVPDAAALAAAVQKIAFPAVCKTATAGYDGRGQWRLEGPSDVAALAMSLPQLASGAAGFVVERWVPHEKELSVIVVQDVAGNRVTYPVAENVHENGILRTSQTPAQIDPALAEDVRCLAHEAVACVGGAGVFCVEMFLLADGHLVINEIAPRPHNSGHYTMDAAAVSQFEQQVRVLCGLPLGRPDLHHAHTATINLIGPEVKIVQSAPCLDQILGDARLYLYGKREVRPGRKMGHLSVTGTDAATVEEKRAGLLALLGGAER
jgi:5-(carboxyamino)imidazole ribonucleotide synthase